MRPQIPRQFASAWRRTRTRPAARRVMLPLVIDLEDTYRRLARPWAHEQLAARYEDARRPGAARGGQGDDPPRPIGVLATAIPPAGTVAVAIHVLHALPDGTRSLGRELIDAGQRKASAALASCHRALELDGAEHGYTADEWLPVVYDIAAQLLESASLDLEPPTVVRVTQQAISWLSRTLAELDLDSRETPARSPRPSPACSQCRSSLAWRMNRRMPAMADRRGPLGVMAGPLRHWLRP